MRRYAIAFLACASLGYGFGALSAHDWHRAWPLWARVLDAVWSFGWPLAVTAVFLTDLRTQRAERLERAARREVEHREFVEAMRCPCGRGA